MWQGVGTWLQVFRQRGFLVPSYVATLSASAVAFLLGLAAFLTINPGHSQNKLANPEAGFVGSHVCATCHQAESKAWAVSHHAQAMQPASPSTVLGDFNGATAQHFGSKARFYRKDDRFFVGTEGKDGKASQFEVRYTFGLYPLQQYLAEFPDGRLQALPYAWNTRSKDEGGQRWFHLYPNEDIPPSDALHWTRPQQNWNYMCAECHSTHVQKNYDAVTDTFHTAFSEVSVGCEACHGAGSGHVHWAMNGQASNIPNRGFPSVPGKREPIAWAPDPKTGSPSVSASLPSGGVMEACDRCHSRRGEFSEVWRPGQPLADTHLPAFLTSDLFEDDGQMKDEVFNTSSFQQSKMFAKGVICTDCHNPHSGKLKAARNEVCSQCHSPQRFATLAHTGHDSGPASPNCIACHMPVRTFMVIDQRHDHSFRIPRPDLTVKFGVSNTCSSCHADHDAAWAAAAMERWHGPVRKGFQTYAEAFHAVRLDLPEARNLLIKVAQDASTPAIARGTALLLLRDKPSAAAVAEISRGLRDGDPMVRIGALASFESLPPEARWKLARDSLSDSVRAVRMQAASTLADMPPAGLNPADRAALEKASQEYIAAREFNADRAEERASLAGFYARQGKPGLAEQEYLAAIRLAPRQVPPRVDLADLYRALGREAEAEVLLRETILEAPGAAAPHHALGLALIRQKRYGEAIESLRRATELEPAQPRYSYVYAVALQSIGQWAEARKVLENALLSSPSNIDILTVLLQDALRSRELKSTLSYAERLRIVRPDDVALAQFTNQLKASLR
ncbi:MAG: tetratricopeptide repeat protein [Rhodomicrobium sp.]